MNRIIKVTISASFTPICFVLIALSVAIPTIATVASGKKQVGMYILFSAITFIALLALLWSKRFRVTLDGRTFSVRKTLSPERSFDTSEITGIIWRRTLSNLGLIENIVISKGKKKISVDSSMTGFEHFSKQLVQIVPQNIISFVDKDIRTKR